MIEELPSSSQHASARSVYIYILLTCNCLFRLIISNNWLSHNQSLGVFTIKGTGGTPHAVRLFPTESCSCPSTTRCYHIMAARISIGLDHEGTKKKINLTQLRKNTRNRLEKKSGRKAPRPGDYDVIAAPDSTATGPFFPIRVKLFAKLLFVIVKTRKGCNKGGLRVLNPPHPPPPPPPTLQV